MPFGHELVLALDDATLTRLEATLPPAPEDDDQDQPQDPGEARYALIGSASYAVEVALREAHADLLTARFGNATWARDPWAAGPHPTPPSAADRTSKLTALTPAGPREFRPLSIEGYGDEDDPLAVAGISLLSRYRPVWLDWAHAHGGSHLPITLDPATLDMVDQARDRLSQIIPEVRDAPIVVVPQWY